MKKQIFRVDSDGYNGAWYPASTESKKENGITLAACMICSVLR